MLKSSDKSKRYFCWKKKTEAILFRTGRETFLFSLCLAIERDSIRSCTYMREPISVEKLCRKLEEERSWKSGQPIRKEQRKREKERGDGLLEYILESKFPCAEIATGRFGKRKKGEEEIEKKEEPPLSQRGAQNERSRLLSRKNAFHVSAMQPCQGCAP